MTIFVFYACAYFFGLASITYLGYFLLVRKNRREAGENTPISLENVTIVVPFRNEAENLKVLVDSFLQSNFKVPPITFVNDHSTDDSCTIIERNVEKLDYTLLQNTSEGKKAAIRTGMKNVQTEYVLTLDADVVLQPNYWEELSCLPKKDMWILPVKMIAKGWRNWFTMDYFVSMLLNQGLAGWFRPIVASGANLLFSKIVFEQVDSIAEHEHIASGDDVFLLRDFIQHKKQIGVATSRKMAVETAVPSSWKVTIQQRLRWIGKTSAVKDEFANFTGIVLLLASFFPCAFLMADTTIALKIMAFKFPIDLVLMLPYAIRNRQLTNAFIFPIYSLFLPVYFLLLLLSQKFMRVTWKGREV